MFGWNTACKSATVMPNPPHTPEHRWIGNRKPHRSSFFRRKKARGYYLFCPIGGNVCVLARNSLHSSAAKNGQPQEWQPESTATSSDVRVRQQTQKAMYRTLEHTLTSRSSYMLPHSHSMCMRYAGILWKSMGISRHHVFVALRTQKFGFQLQMHVRYTNTANRCVEKSKTVIATIIPCTIYLWLYLCDSLMFCRYALSLRLLIVNT